MSIAGYLGIDAGTQGLSVVLTDGDLQVLATGEAGYDMCPGLEEGCYEQNPADWTAALSAALQDLRSRLPAELDYTVAGIGISGQMHGEVLVDQANRPLQPARLWCDARNEDEGRELTAALGVKMPKRITAARWLWTLRHRPEIARQVAHLTTPGGWLSFCLTGQWTLGVGDAAGMFPIDPQTRDYDAARLSQFDAVAATTGVAVPALKTLLPEVRVAGQSAGQLTPAASEWLGLPAGIPVAPAEGDQPASLAGSLIGEAGMVSVSFGTSVCANSVGDRPFVGVSDAIDHFCAPDGKPINMVWLRNGTTYMNTLVEMFGQTLATGSGSAFDVVMPLVVAADDDCGGLLALPFMDDEPGLGVSRGGRAVLWNLQADNATPGNAVKAALLATMFNLRMGCEILAAQGFPRTELVLSGGLTRTPELAQLLADVMHTPVLLPQEASEGCAWGAALMAKFTHQSATQPNRSWSQFLEAQADQPPTRWVPDADRCRILDDVYHRYRELFAQVMQTAPPTLTAT